MADAITTLSVFGLDNVLVSLTGQSSITGCRPNSQMRSTFRNSVGDSSTVTVVVSDQEASKHTETWLWLLKNFKVVQGKVPTYLLMRIGSMSSVSSALQNVKSMMAKYPAVTKFNCFDTDEVLLSSYRDMAKAKNIMFWRMHKVVNGATSSFDSSFIDKV